ncbi:MAG TPA: histidine phosphatase family protein [Myxococcota bacterium]
MSELRRIVLLRHGDTVGDSRHRFHGSGDVALSGEGRRQVREAARALRGEVFDLVVASPLQRSWQSAWLAGGGAPIRLEPDFREIHFGRWEGMTAEEIEASDPILYRDWQAKARGFEYPSGEPLDDFQARIVRGVEKLQASGAPNVLAVLHKGVIRRIVEHLVGAPLQAGVPELGHAVAISRRPDGRWFVGRHGSNPESLAQRA